MAEAIRRLSVIAKHLDAHDVPQLSMSEAAGKGHKGSKAAGDYKYGTESYKWNGWGFSDSAFVLNERGQVKLTGDRYLFSGVEFPNFRDWCEDKLGLDVTKESPAQRALPSIQQARRNTGFLRDIEGHYKAISFDDYSRVYHSHGHTLEEMFQLRNAHLPRVVDVVIWPQRHEHVERIMEAAVKHNVVIIPYGGGTTVTNSLMPPAEETRMIVSLDMHEMARIKSIDRESMLACIEAGATGVDLDNRLRAEGFCMGHEPDSFEFSSLGGWVATRASGMKKNVYGNIDDIVVGIKVVTPSGTFTKEGLAPRTSVGPDLHHFILGSEGTLGVITEVVIRLRPLPAVREYGSLVFPDFERGVAFLRDMTRQGVSRLPASIRLVDNMQFQFGQVLKPGHASKMDAVMSWAKKFYVTKLKGFEVDKMTAVTLLFEGTRKIVDQQQSAVYSTAAKYGGLRGGEENGKTGYFLTYMIAYLRDFGFNYWFIGESFETSVPWRNVHVLVRNVKNALNEICKQKGIVKEPFVSARVTQCYETGVCVYFYFGFLYRGLKDPVKTYLEIEDEARDVILANGGSLSHHHGIGKLRKKWVPRVLSPVGVQMLTGVKHEVDPKNIMGNANLINSSE